MLESSSRNVTQHFVSRFDSCVQVEERQRLKVAKETASGDNDYDPVVAAKDKAEFLLTFTGVQAQAEVCRCLECCCIITNMSDYCSDFWALLH